MKGERYSHKTAISTNKMDKKVRNIIIIILIIISIIVCLLLEIYKNKIKNSDIENDSENIDIEEIEKTEVLYIESEENLNGWKQVASPNDYYTVISIIDRYFNNMAKFEEGYVTFSKYETDAEALAEATKQEKEASMEAIEGLLSKYISIEHMEDKELENILNKYAGKLFETEKMYYKNQGNSIFSYFISGKLDENDYSIIVIINKASNICTLLPNEYIIKEYGKNANIKDMEFSEDVLNIEANNYNKVKYSSISDQTICLYYFGNYLNKLKKDTKGVFETLDTEYREKRFGSYENFSTYVKDNYNNLTGRILSEYSVTVDESDGQIIYICKDQYGCYYIFKVAAVMDYTLYLDNHNIDLQEFTTKYNSLRNENKVAVNIEKIKEALNTKDYEYIYGKLDDTFKNNYYPTQKDFEEYVKSNLFTVNLFEYTSIQESNGLYIYTVIISDGEGRVSSEVNMNVVMKLNEGTDFTISFSIK